MRYILPLFALLVSCASQSKVFKSPDGRISLIHDPGNKDRSPVYRIYARDVGELGQVNSIVGAAAMKNVPGLPVNHEVYWSPTSKTALVYENMSDASPDYQHVLIRFGPDSQSFDASKVDVGTRFMPPPNVYAEWPSIRQISDSAIELEWDSEPRRGSVEISALLSEAKSASEQAAQSDDGHFSN